MVLIRANNTVSNPILICYCCFITFSENKLFHDQKLILADEIVCKYLALKYRLYSLRRVAF